MNKYTKQKDNKILIDKLQNFVNKQEYGCWEWTLSLNECGYGEILIDQERYLIHRLFYTVYKGNLVEGLVIDHLCRNRACCNPHHLEQVTQAENVKRGEAGKHFAEKAKLITHCPQGHPYNEENTYYAKRKDNGKSRQCRICKYEAVKKHHSQAVVKLEYKAKRLNISIEEAEALGHGKTNKKPEDFKKKPRLTHCKRGHELTPDNIKTQTVNDPVYGSREKHLCKICLSERQRKSNKKRKDN